MLIYFVQPITYIVKQISFGQFGLYMLKLNRIEFIKVIINQ